jgi:urease accessory protein
VIPAPPRVGRDGRLALRFERRAAGTIPTRRYCTVPLQVLAPLALDDPASVVSVVNPTGGLVGGDTLSIEIDVGRDAHALLTTPSATKVYRTAGAPARQDVVLRLAPGARLEWIPDHTIPFPGSRFRQTLAVDMAEGAALVLVDAFAAGRVARGEAWRFAELDSRLTVRDVRGALLHDRFVLRDGEPRGLGLTDGRPYFATIVVVAATGLEAFAGAVGAFEAGGAAIGLGALARGGVVVRCLAADAPALGDAITAVWGAARATVLGLPPLALRKC